MDWRVDDGQGFDLESMAVDGFRNLRRSVTKKISEEIADSEAFQSILTCRARSVGVEIAFIVVCESPVNLGDRICEE